MHLEGVLVFVDRSGHVGECPRLAKFGDGVEVEGDVSEGSSVGFEAGEGDACDVGVVGWSEQDDSLTTVLSAPLLHLYGSCKTYMRDVGMAA